MLYFMTNFSNIKAKFKKYGPIAWDENFYLDFNFLENEDIRIDLDKENVNIDSSSDRGVKIRLWDNSKFLECGTSDLSDKEIENIVKTLVSDGRKNQHTNNENVELKFDREMFQKDFLNFKEDIDIEKILEKLKHLKEKLLLLDSDILNIRLIFSKDIEKRIFSNKYKLLSEEIELFFLAMVVFVNTDSGNKMIYESFVSNKLDIFDRAECKLLEFKEKIKNYKKANKLRGGKYKVLLAPHLTGLLAHESFGHGMEADTMMRGRALASDWAGVKIANENVNIVDYPNIEGKNGFYNFDAEGNIAQKVYLVKNGVIETPMADFYSKTRLGLEKSSSSRIEAFDHKNYVRMSNTYFEAGNDRVEDLLKEIEDGIFITDSSGGMEDPKAWGVQIQGCFGQRIKNGKLCDEFYDGFTFTGFLPDIMKNISGISDNIFIEGGGRCGKGHKEWVRVSEGGPYLLIEEVVLG
jgi:TldD protein